MPWLICACLCDFGIIKRIKHCFCVLTFVKPDCDNVLQPEPPSGESCNTLSRSGLANVNTEKNVISLAIYLPFQYTRLKWQ